MNLADLIARASSASTVGAAEIAEAAKYAAGAMAQLGRSPKEMLAMSAVLAQVGMYGSMAGVSLKEFYQRAAKFDVFKDAQGNLKPTVEIIKILRQRLKGLGQAERQLTLQKIFGERGMRVAIALLNEGKGSYEEILKAMDSSISLQEKLNTILQGFNKQLESLKGTARSTAAILFRPLLDPLTKIVQKTNELVSALGNAASSGKRLSQVVSGVSAGALGAAVLGTAYFSLRGILQGRRVLTGIGGLKGLLSGVGGTAAHLAKAKMLEKTAGVQPVYVVNWPDGILSPATTAAEAAAGVFRKGGIFSRLKGALTGSLAFLRTVAGAAFTSSPVAAVAAVGAAAVGGWKLGRWLDEKFKISDYLADKLFKAIYGRKEEKTKSQIDMNIVVQDDRVKVIAKRRGSTEGETKIKLPRGRF